MLNSYNWQVADLNQMDNHEIIKRIITLNKQMCEFWSKPEGWAPVETAKLISKSRLDWQISLTNYLPNWINNTYLEEDFGSLILAWTNLGSIVEGSIKLALSVYYKDYLNDDDKIKFKGVVQEPDGLMLDKLRRFCNGKLWDTKSSWDDWILHIQQRRNSIHAFRDRELGSFTEYYRDLATLLLFIRHINSRLPYPDEIYIPREV